MNMPLSEMEPDPPADQSAGGSLLESIKSKYDQADAPRSDQPLREPRRARSAFDVQARVRDLAPQYGVPEDLALKVLGQESGGRQYNADGSVLTSPRGARGAMQVLPATGRALGYDVNDPEQNVRAGLDYFGRSYKRWDGDEALSVAGYHAGIEDAEKALRNPRGNPKTHAYVRSILGDEAYNQAVGRYGQQPFAQPTGNSLLESIKSKYDQPDASAAPAQLSTLESIKSKYDQPATSSTVPPKEIFADDLAKLAKEKYAGDELAATTDLYNQGYTIKQRAATDVTPEISRATGVSQPTAPVDAHAVPQVRAGQSEQPFAGKVQITIGDDETPDVKEIGKRVYRSLGFTDSEAEQYAKDKGYPDAPSAFYANYGDPLKAARAVKQAAQTDPSALGRVNIPGLTSSAIQDAQGWINDKRRREYQEGMAGWHQSTLERLAALSPEQREQAAYERAQQGPVPEDVRQALNVSPGAAPRLIAGTVESLMPWLPMARKMVGAQGSTANDVSTGMNAAAQGVGGVMRSAEGAQQLVNAPLYHIPGVRDLLNWRDDQINGLVNEVSSKAQKELNLHKPSGLYGEILESTSRMAPEVAASILLPEGKAVHLAYWANLAFHNAKARGASDADALKEAALAGAMIGAAEPLRPLAGAVGDGAKDVLIKAGARAGLGAVTGYGIAKAQGATDQQAISQAVQFGAMNLTGAGGRQDESGLHSVPTDAAPRMQAFDVPEGMATAMGREAVNPRAGAAARVEYEAQRAAEESDQPAYGGMPRLRKGDVAAEPTSAPVAAPTESRAGVLITARGSDAMGTVREIQDALRQGKHVQVVRGGDDPETADLYSALTDEFGNHSGISFANPPQSQRGLAESIGRLGAAPPREGVQTPALIDATDQAAHEAATSPLNDLSEPSAAMKEAGNYVKGHTRIAGLDVTIENPQGSTRKPEWPPLKSHYGYIRRTVGADSENLDVFVKPGTPQDYNGPVFVVDQLGKDGSFDEHKIMLGFPDEPAARAGYAENYTKGWKVGPIREFKSPVEFRDWLKNGDTTRPTAEDRGRREDRIADARSPAQAASGRQNERVVSVNDKQVTLTDPEKIAALDEAQGRYDRQIELAKRAGGERGAALRKQAGFEFATAKRQITGELTGKEQAAQAARDESFYKGKRVEFELNGRTVTGAVSSTPFGKVRVQMADGQMRTLEPGDVRPATGKLSTADELARAAAPRMSDDQRASLGQLADALGRDRVESLTRQQYGKSAAELSQSEARNVLADLRKQARAKGLTVGDESGPQSASQFVRERGGIQYDEMYSGETRRLNPKEAETTGLVSRSRSRGLPPDKMREAMVEAGYLPEDATISDMLETVERDAAGQKTYSQQDEARQRQIDDDLAASEHEYLSKADESGRANYDRISDAANDPEFARWLNRLHEPDATAADERAFYETAQRYGIPEDFISETLAYSREHRTDAAGETNTAASPAQSAAAPARGEPGEAGQPQSDVTHHSQLQPRDDAGQFAGPPDYTSKSKLAEPPKQTEHGYFHHFLHRQEGGQFFNDPAVKLALGLPESAKSSEVHSKLRDVLAPEIPGERPSLSRVSPDELRDWALERDLPDETIAKLDKARVAAKERVSRNVELGGRGDDHPQIVEWRTDLGERSNELSFGVNADRAMKAAAVLGYDLARSAKDFASWSKQMVDRLGERVKPLLRNVWDTVRGFAAGDEADAGDIDHLREKTARALENQKGAVSLDLLTLGMAPLVRKINADVRKLFAPDTLSDRAGVTGNAIRANRGAYERDVKAAESGLHSLRNAFLKMPERDQVDFLDRLQNRQPQPTPELQAAHDTLRNAYDAEVRRLPARQQVRFATDYLSTFWTDSEAARQFTDRWFQTHPRTDPPTVKDGLAAGLKPKSTNPVDVALWHYDTARRFRFGQDFMGEMQSKGLAEFVPPGKGPLHADWVEVDPRISTKTGDSAGSYHMPDDAARVVNAWLSPDIKSRDDLLGAGFRGLNRSNNWMNMFTLGWSAFHGSFTGLQSMFGQFNNALQHAQAGRLGRAAVEAAKIPVAPVLDVRLGHKIIAEYNRPGSQPPAIARMVDATMKAGGRPGEDRAFQTNFRKSFVEAVRAGDYPKAIKNSLGAVMEVGTAPILGGLVPRLKAAAFAKRAMLELDRLGPSASEDAQRGALSKQWDIVDDMFGQVVYDNSFANNAVKDVLKSTIGRFGWQYGTLRALGGAAAETAAAPARIVRAVANRSTVGNAPISDRAGYVMGMTLLTGIAGGITTALMTSEKPKGAKDYFFPRTGGTLDNGQPERIAFPTYASEAYNWLTAPGKTATHKISPALHLFNDLVVRNADFQNVQIRNPEDSIMQQAKDVAGYLGKQVLPISVQNIQKSKEQGQGTGRQVAGVFGIKSAPASVDESPALALTRSYVGDRLPSGVVTKEQMAKRQAMRELEKGFRNNVPMGKRSDELIRSGVVTDDDVDRAQDHAEMSPLEAGFKRLSYEQKLNVLDKATTEERKLLVPILDDAEDSLDNLPDAKAKQLQQRAKKYLP